MTALLSSASFLAGIVLGYLLASKRASEREHPVEFGGSLDLDPSQRARLYEGGQ
jgi:hypothetical protein